MCIRDSRGVRHAVLIARRELDDHLAHHLDLARRLVEVDQHCLLYTSDAADDLPCVDLGGRRVIKKIQNR